MWPGRVLSMAGQKQRESRQTNPSKTQYLASCFCKGLQLEQESALAFIANHNATEIPHEKNLSQAEDVHGKLKEAIHG